jgi:uncharacterized protein
LPNGTIGYTHLTSEDHITELPPQLPVPERKVRLPAALPVHLSGAVRPPEWPNDLLDVATLRQRGWRPTPFQQFVLKVHSRCNLACDYCYIYRMADQSWRLQPATMTFETVAAAAGRIAEHACTFGLAEVRIVLHGGEPLLAGSDFIAHTAKVLRHTIGEEIRVRIGIQTNGVLLTEELLRVLLKHHICVGVSLDGDRPATDRHRRYANGRSSHAAVSRGLRLLCQVPYRDLFCGLLCTVDLANDPIATYETLLEFTPPAVDFLLPHGNWTTRPPHRTSDPTATPYADWLISIFDRWYATENQGTRIRLFLEIISLVLGGPSRSETVGFTPASCIIIDTDGSLEQTGALKAAYHGAPVTGLNVVDHTLDAALDHPSIAARQLGMDALCATCYACPVRDVCGGGLYPHRYRAGSGFRNPSVYCPDLRRLIEHIRTRVLTDIRDLCGRAR